MSFIMQSRNTILFNKNQPGVKKSVTGELDVPMWCFAAPELGERIGLYIFTNFTKRFIKR